MALCNRRSTESNIYLFCKISKALASGTYKSAIRLKLITTKIVLPLYS